MSRVLLCTTPLLLVGAAIAPTFAQAQGNGDRIQLSVVMAQGSSDRIPAAANGIIRERLEGALAREGAGQAFGDAPARFAGRASVMVLEKSTAMTAPPMTVISSEVSVVFGDVVSGATVAEYRKATKGVGQTEDAAFRDIARQVRFEGEEWRTAVRDARRGIIAYFERSCDGILRDGRTLVARAEFERALFILGGIPQEASACHERAADAMVLAYTAYLRNQCEVGYAQARASWAADKSRAGAIKAADLLVVITPSSPCARDAEGLLTAVTDRLAEYDAAAAKERAARAAFGSKQYEDQLDLRRKEFTLQEKQSDQGHVERKLAVSAARDVGVAWARALENRTPDVYRETFIVR